MKLLILVLLLTIPTIIFGSESKQNRLSIETIKSLDSNSNLYSKNPYHDLDEDGVADKQDFCANSALGYKIDKNGCELDSDKDGIYDSNDQCPKTIEGRKVNFLGCERDKDFDRVVDHNDRCPHTTIGTKINTRGCSINIDSDGDGVINSKDKCPRTPKGNKVNSFGCISKKIVISNIIFDYNSYKIRADQKSVLDRNISHLKNVKFNEFIVITGHTDSIGGVLKNKKLSWHRAQEIKFYLVKNLNYDANKILIYGKGEGFPIGSNLTEKGRQQNRRIRFSITNKHNLPVGVKLQIPTSMKNYFNPAVK
jgi:OOP family OmpA-OmpF porin